jgi:predicted nucleic acid-binding protein
MTDRVGTLDAMPERLTIDQTVLIDFLDEGGDRHALAEELLDLSERGEIELAVAPQGYRAERRGDLTEQIREMFTRKGIVEARQVARVSEVTYLPFVIGHYVEGFPEACAGSSPGHADRFHVETHLADGRDVFITDDERLLSLCDRLREQGFPIVAMKLADYLYGHRSGSPR